MNNTYRENSSCDNDPKVVDRNLIVNQSHKMCWSKRLLIYVSCPVLIIDNINLILICSRLLNFYEYIAIAEINKSQKIPRVVIKSAKLS